jgi:hypothetical protein
VSLLLGDPTCRLYYKKVSSKIVQGRVRLVPRSSLLMCGRFGYGGITGGTLIDNDYMNAAGTATIGAMVSGPHRSSRTGSPCRTRVRDTRTWPSGIA